MHRAIPRTAAGIPRCQPEEVRTATGVRHTIRVRFCGRFRHFYSCSFAANADQIILVEINRCVTRRLFDVTRCESRSIIVIGIRGIRLTVLDRFVAQTGHLLHHIGRHHKVLPRHAADLATFRVRAVKAILRARRTCLQIGECRNEIGNLLGARKQHF